MLKKLQRSQQEQFDCFLVTVKKNKKIKNN